MLAVQGVIVGLIVILILLSMSTNFLHQVIFFFSFLILLGIVYGLMGAEWMMTSQIMVYGGGVVILLLFVITTIGLNPEKKDDYLLRHKISLFGTKYTHFTSLLLSILFFYINWRCIKALYSSQRITEKPISASMVDFGNALLFENLLSFELSSVLLLGALIGGASIARAMRGDQ